MKKYFSLGSMIISACNFGMNIFITKKQRKSSRNRLIAEGVMVVIAVIVSLVNTMQIIKTVENNGSKR